jgi:hypothetical protein
VQLATDRSGSWPRDWRCLKELSVMLADGEEGQDMVSIVKIWRHYNSLSSLPSFSVAGTSTSTSTTGVCTIDYLVAFAQVKVRYQTTTLLKK